MHVDVLKYNGMIPEPPYNTDEEDAEQDFEDAERYRWLRNRLAGFDFDWQEGGACVIAFSWPQNVPIGGNCDMSIDAAMSATVTANT